VLVHAVVPLEGRTLEPSTYKGESVEHPTGSASTRNAKEGSGPYTS
jgi:hypothetical protein